MSVFQIVAHAVEFAVTFDAAHGPFQVGRAEAVDDRLARVDQRQAGVNRVSRQLVPAIGGFYQNNTSAYYHYEINPI